MFLVSFIRFIFLTLLAYMALRLSSSIYLFHQISNIFSYMTDGNGSSQIINVLFFMPTVLVVAVESLFPLFCHNSRNKI